MKKCFAHHFLGFACVLLWTVGCSSVNTHRASSSTSDAEPLGIDFAFNHSLGGSWRGFGVAGIDAGSVIDATGPLPMSAAAVAMPAYAAPLARVLNESQLGFAVTALEPNDYSVIPFSVSENETSNLVWVEVSEFEPLPILSSGSKRRAIHTRAAIIRENERKQNALDTRVESDPPLFRLIPVYYATDRKPACDLGAWRASLRAKGSESVYFGGESGSLQYGLCTVSIPARVHSLGALERPKFWKLELSEALDRHFTIRGIKPLDRDNLTARVAGYAANSGELFVFIHGFNVRFNDAAMRTAQLAHDIGFEGAPVLFSWASEGSVLNYVHDYQAAELAAPLLADFLRDLARDSQVGKIHLIAHSMGNCVLLDALSELARDPVPPTFAEVILAAPDFNRQKFLQHVVPEWPKIRSLTQRVTLYASEDDWALRVSQKLSKYPRLGQSGDNLVVIADMETIDASGLCGADMLTHSYFANIKQGVEDVAAVIRQGASPELRRLKRLAVPETGLNYWKLSKER